MKMIIALLHRIVFGKIGPSFDVIIAAYRIEDTLKLMNLIRILKININIRNLYYIANHNDVSKILEKQNINTILKGSNKDAEWSAYQQGIIASSSDTIAQGGVIVMNDTVVSHRSFTIIRYMKFINFLKGKKESLEIAGFCDGDMSNGFEIFGKQVGPWVSSYLFYLSPDLVRTLGVRLIFRQNSVEEWFESCSVDKFFPDWINNALKDHLEDWLFKGGWYGSQKLSISNIEGFRNKLKSILYEKILSVEVKSHGRIHDIMPKATLSRYFNDKIENFFKRKMPNISRRLLGSLTLIN